MCNQSMNFAVNPVSEPTDKYIALQSSSTANQLAALNYELQCKNECLQHELEVARREKRKAIVDEKLAKVNDYDMIGVVTTYTDNSNNVDIFIQNFPWPLVFVIVVCTDWTLRKDYVVIMAGAKASNGCCFMIEKSKLGHSGLLQEMLQKNGAKFNPSIARNRRMRILERHFCSPETCNEKKFMLKALSGWDSNYRFHSRENSDVWEEALKKEHLPVYDKSFSRTLPEQGDLIQYIQAFRLIGDKRTRCILLLYPFLGLLGSLLQQQKYDSQNFYLNLIVDGDLPDRIIAAFFQIYNRSDLQLTESNLSEKEFRAKVERICDDLLLLDGRKNNGESDYISRKKRGCIDRVSNMVSNGKYLSNGNPIRFALITLTDEFRRGEHVINLLIDQESFDMEQHRKMIKKGVLDHILAGVVDYVESHQEDVKDVLIHDLAELEDERMIPFVFAEEILSQYFMSKGIDLFVNLNLPHGVDYTSLFDSEADDDESLIAQFIDIIRDEIRNCCRVELSTRAPYVENAVYYNKDYLDFPVDMLNKIFLYNHCYELLQRVLRILRSRGLLISDSLNSMVKKCQHGNVRKDYYRLPIHLFNRKGSINILSLMEEGD